MNESQNQFMRLLGQLPARLTAEYEEAVKTFEPYDKIKEVNSDARKAGQELIAEGKTVQGRKTFIYVNNRLEGNALETIQAMISDDEGRLN